MQPPKVSVVIPVYRDWSGVERCLVALAGQTLPRDAFEILVVDNDDEPLPEDRRPPGARYLHEPEGFSYAARNAGWRAARAPVLAFTDADCVPAADWLWAGLAYLDAHPEVGVVGGSIEVVPERDTLAARYDTAFGLRQEEFFTLYTGFATANVLARRATLERVGGFDAALESGGDIDFCWRASDAGIPLAYVPVARVRHPARESLGQLTGQARRIARGVFEYSYRRRFPTKARLAGAVLFAFRPRVVDWSFVLRGGRGSERLPPRQRPAVLLVRIALHYAMALQLAACLLGFFRRRSQT